MKQRTYSHETRQSQKSVEISPLLKHDGMQTLTPRAKASSTAVVARQEPEDDDSTTKYGASNDMFDESEAPVTPSMSLETIACYSIVTLLVLIATGIVVVLVRSGKDGLNHAVVAFMEWMEAAVINSPIQMAVLVIIPLMTITTILCIPYTFWAAGIGFLYSSLGGGGVWSIIVACVVAGLGIWFGCFCSFLLGRQLLRKQTKQLMQKYPQIKSLDIVLERKPQISIWLVTISKLAPVFPSFVTNYGFAATSVDSKSFAIGTVFGALPMPFVFVYMGSSLDSISKIFSLKLDGSQSILIFVIGLVMLLSAMIFVVRYSRNELQRMLAEDEDGVEIIKTESMADINADIATTSDPNHTV